jgi:para-aminobenzoate synthetase component 1
MPSSSVRPLAAFRQELPYRPLWPLAHLLAGREPGVAFLDAQGEATSDGSGCSAAEGRFAALGWRPVRTLRWPTDRRGAIEGLRQFVGEPRLAQDPEAPVPFRGGFLGWLSYDLGRDVERLPSRNAVDPGVPDFVLAEYETLLVEDRRDRRLFLAGACDPMEGPSRHLVRQAEVLDWFRALGEPEPVPGPAAADVRDDLSRDEYLRRVRRVLDYIRAGDIFQANLAHRFTGRSLVPPREIHRRLRAESPAPRGCFLDLGGPVVLSISPETFLTRRGERVTTRPIKGTRPRGADPAADAARRAALESSEKDRAELAMIVDLLRNDLGRVARTGTVKVEAAREIRAHPTLFHADALVSASLDPSIHAADLLRATMPGGSVTGAPKIRAMEILEELEDVRRGPYCGAAGWIGYDGDLDLNILIRTVVVREGALSFHVGGGIVADSVPEEEHEETLVKARAILRALTEVRA